MTNILESIQPERHAAIAASAGSGKTWLLIARILRLLLNDVEPGSILAVTFTEKAAAEMKQRLYEKLQSWSTEQSLEEALREIGLEPTRKAIENARQLYKKIIHNPHPPQLMTFHSFCSHLLRQFALEINISPDFKILSDNKKLQMEAFDNLCRRTITEPERMRQMDQLTELCNHNFFNVRTALLELLDHSAEWMSLIENQSIAVPGDGTSNKDLKIPTECFEWCQNALQQHRTQLMQKKGVKASQSAGAMEALLNRLDTENLTALELFEQLEAIYFTQGGTVRKHLEDALGAEATELEAKLDQLKSQVNQQRNKLWYALGLHLHQEYQALKDRRQLLDFTDLEWYALQLIKNKNYHYVQCRINQKIEHILVDEFQDTNPLQWQLIKPLLEEMSSQEGFGSLFIVGDPKQSIYGFRRANPELQQEATKWIKENLGGRSYSLDCSYRSSQEIVSFVNAKFSPDAEFSEKIASFNLHETKLKIAGKVSFLPFFEKKDKPATTQTWRRILREAPQQHIDDQHILDEANCVAQHIRDLLSKETQIHTNAQGEQRTISCKDILILARRRKNLIYFGKALAQHDIPVINAANSESNSLIEIEDCIALVRFLCYPHDDLALVQVLRSPLFFIDDTQLVELGEIRQHSYYKRLKMLAKSKPFWHSLATQLDQWLSLSRQLPPHDLLNHIYTQNHLITRYRALHQPDMQDLSEQYLFGFLHYALNFEEGRYPNLPRLLADLIEHQQSLPHQNDPLFTIEDNQYNGVRLMTIHQAKGLESPVVFLVDTGHSGTHRETFRALIRWGSSEPAPSLFQLFPPARLRDKKIKEHQAYLKEQENREEVNILYVALTRARQYLYLSGNGKKENSWYARLQQGECGEHDEQLAEPIIAETSKPRQAKQIHIPVSRFHLSTTSPPLVFSGSVIEHSPSSLESSRHASNHEPANQDNTLQGSLIHRMLHLLHGQTSHDRIMAIIQTEFPQCENQMATQCLAEATALVQDEALQAVFDDSLYRQTFNEMPLSFIHEDKQYYGFIDRLCIGEDTAWIIDYKTHRRAEKNTLEALAAPYQKQMYVYTCGVQLLFPKHRVRTSLLLTKTHQLFDYHFDIPKDASDRALT